MKHWKRNPNSGTGKPGSPAPNRNVVLRFYPPQAALGEKRQSRARIMRLRFYIPEINRCDITL